MKTISESASVTSAKIATKPPNPVFFAKAGSGHFFPPISTVSSQAEKASQTGSGPVSASEKRLYRTSDGKTVELPAGMTAEQAVQLEAEAKAAEKQLGKRPPPKPVPEIKSVAKKDGKPAKIQAKGKKTGKGKSKLMPGIGRTAGVLLKGVNPGKVAQYLAVKGAPVLQKGLGMLNQLKRNEQTHDDATEKLRQSEQAIVIPLSEGQSKSNAGQVNSVSARPAPPVDENKARQKFQESLAANIPQSIEDVDNFKRDNKGKHMGADVMSVLQGDKNAVSTTFADMETTLPPTPPEQIPESLPPEEMTPPTAGLNLGQGAIAPLQQEHTDLSNYTKEADGKLKEEGISQEQLDMVDSGDLAEANKEKRGMESKAKTEPTIVKVFAQQTTLQLDQELKQQEKYARDSMKAKRKASLGTTAQKQKSTKIALEKKREEVAAKINTIYTAAQTTVKQRLANLEIDSKRWFDEDNARATETFQNNVDRELAAFKKDRYSGFFGWARKAKDWLLGMDELPEVNAIFSRNRNIFENTIRDLVTKITNANKLVIKECKDTLATAKADIQSYVNSLSPELKAIGANAQQDMNAKLSELDNSIAKTEQNLANLLADKQKAAINAIDDRINKMKESMSGALSKLGKLLLLAAKKFFSWALEKFGYSLQEIEAIINKGAAILKAIFTQPIQFVKNLVNAAVTGFKNFGKNFLKHLKNALFEWLTGSLEGLVLPQTWDFKGIVGVALQMIGISYQNIRKHMVAVMGEPVVANLEKTFTLVKTLITEGPMAAWEQLKEMANDMKEAFIEAVKDFIKTKIIEQAIQWLASIFIPGAGIIKAIIAIYDTVVFFIQKAKQIAQMIGNFLSSIGQIAMGNIGAAADALESGLARGLTLVISFLAQLLHLGGITNKIKTAIQKIRDKVDAVILKVVNWIADKAKNLFGKVKAGAQAVFSWAFAKTTFSEAGGKRHSLYVEGDDTPRLMIASAPLDAEAFLDWYLKEKGTEFEKKKSGLISAVRGHIKAAMVIAKDIAGLKKKGEAWKARQQDLLNKNVELSAALSELIGKDESIGKTIEKYKLEGVTGTYGSIPKPPYDDLTADHQPQAAVLTAAAKFSFFGKNGELHERAESRAHQGYAINLHKARHMAGATYGYKGKETKESFLERIKPLVKDKPASEQRKTVVVQLKSELRRDVAAIKNVVRPNHEAPIWSDVLNQANDRKIGKEVVDEIRARIISREDQIANQDLDSLAL